VSAPRPVSLQDRVLQLLQDDGPIPAADIARYFPGVDRGALDVCLGALMRVAKISRTFGKYELVSDRKEAVREGAVKKNTDGAPDSSRPLPPQAQVAKPDAPPSAEEELRANLTPAPATKRAKVAAETVASATDTATADPIKFRTATRAPETPSERAVREGSTTTTTDVLGAPIALPQVAFSQPASSFADRIEARRAAVHARIRGLEADLRAAHGEEAELDQLVAVLPLIEKHGVAG
jgi:hypothetical protein